MLLKTSCKIKKLQLFTVVVFEFSFAVNTDCKSTIVFYILKIINLQLWSVFNAVPAAAEFAVRPFTLIV